MTDTEPCCPHGEPCCHGCSKCAASKADVPYSAEEWVAQTKALLDRWRDDRKRAPSATAKLSSKGWWNIFGGPQK